MLKTKLTKIVILPQIIQFMELGIIEIYLFYHINFYNRSQSGVLSTF